MGVDSLYVLTRNQNFLHYAGILLRLQRTTGIHQAPTTPQAVDGRAQDANLSCVQVDKIGSDQLPLDLRVSRQRSGAGTGYIGEHAVKIALRQVRNVAADD